MQRNWASRLGIAVMAAGVLSACTPKSFAPPSQTLRNEIERVEFTISASPVLDIKEPVSGAGAGAATGAAQGAGGSVVGGASLCQIGDPLACVIGISLGVVIAPVAAVVGAGVGASKAHPGDEVEAAQREIALALNEVKVRAGLEQAFAQAGERHRKDWFVPASTTANQASSSINRPAPPTHSLDVTISEYRFVSRGAFDPDVFLTATVSGNLRRATANSAIYSRTWRYIGPTDTYFELAEKKADLMRVRIKSSYQTIAQKVVDDLFISSAPEQFRARADAGIWTIKAPEYVDEPIQKDTVSAVRPMLSASPGKAPADASHGATPVPDTSHILSDWRQRSDLLRRTISHKTEMMSSDYWRFSEFNIVAATLEDREDNLIRLETRYTLQRGGGPNLGPRPEPRSYERTVIVDDVGKKVVNLGPPIQID